MQRVRPSPWWDKWRTRVLYVALTALVLDVVLGAFHPTSLVWFWVALVIAGTLVLDRIISEKRDEDRDRRIGELERRVNRIPKWRR